MIPSGEQRTVTFGYQFDAPGEYAVSVAEEDEQPVVVTEGGGPPDDGTQAAAQETSGQTPTPDDEFELATSWLIGLASAALTSSSL